MAGQYCTAVIMRMPAFATTSLDLLACLQHLGGTPLHRAALRCRTAVVALLLATPGVDPLALTTKVRKRVSLRKRRSKGWVSGRVCFFG